MVFWQHDLPDELWDPMYQRPEEGECWKKTGWLSGEDYCGLHGRAAGWPCRIGDA